DQIEIDEAVVDRRHQRIGAGCRVQGINVITPRRIDDEEIVAIGNLVAQRVEFLDIRSVKNRKARTGKSDAAPPLSFGAVLQITEKRTLSLVEVNRRDARALIGERNGNVRGR